MQAAESARAQAHAMKKYPALGVAGSVFNREFLARVQRARAERSEVFQASDWPVTLADDVARGLPPDALMAPAISNSKAVRPSLPLMCRRLCRAPSPRGTRCKPEATDMAADGIRSKTGVTTAPAASPTCSSRPACSTDHARRAALPPTAKLAPVAGSPFTRPPATSSLRSAACALTPGDAVGSERKARAGTRIPGLRMATPSGIHLVTEIGTGSLGLWESSGSLGAKGIRKHLARQFHPCGFCGNAWRAFLYSGHTLTITPTVTSAAGTRIVPWLNSRSAEDRFSAADKAEKSAFAFVARPATNPALP